MLVERKSCVSVGRDSCTGGETAHSGERELAYVELEGICVMGQGVYWGKKSIGRREHVYTRETGGRALRLIFSLLSNILPV